MTVMINFTPNGTIAVTASTVSALGQFINPQSIAANDVIVQNAGSNIAFVAFGGSTTAAVIPTTEKLNATPVPAGAIITFTKGNGNVFVAAITSTQTSQLYFTAGQGN